MADTGKRNRSEYAAGATAASGGADFAGTASATQPQPLLSPGAARAQPRRGTGGVALGGMLSPSRLATTHTGSPGGVLGAQLPTTQRSTTLTTAGPAQGALPPLPSEPRVPHAGAGLAHAPQLPSPARRVPHAGAPDITTDPTFARIVSLTKVLLFCYDKVSRDELMSKLAVAVYGPAVVAAVASFPAAAAVGPLPAAAAAARFHAAAAAGPLPAAAAAGPLPAAAAAGPLPAAAAAGPLPTAAVAARFPAAAAATAAVARPQQTVKPPYFLSHVRAPGSVNLELELIVKRDNTTSTSLIGARADLQQIFRAGAVLTDVVLKTSPEMEINGRSVGFNTSAMFLLTSAKNQFLYAQRNLPLAKAIKGVKGAIVVGGVYSMPLQLTKNRHKCIACGDFTTAANCVAGWQVVPGKTYNKATGKPEGLVAEVRYVCAKCWHEAVL